MQGIPYVSYFQWVVIKKSGLYLYNKVNQRLALLITQCCEALTGISEITFYKCMYKVICHNRF